MFDELRALHEKATAGEWWQGGTSENKFFAGKNTVYSEDRVIVDRATYSHVDHTPTAEEFDRQTYADIALIVAAHNQLPGVLDTLDKLLKEKEERDKGCDTCRSFTDGHNFIQAVVEVDGKKYSRSFDVNCCPMCGRKLKEESK